MACFITPLTIGLALALVKRVFKNLYEKARLTFLEITLLGGSAILAVEHVWRGEVTPYPPFLTAAKNPAEIPVMINEVMFVGGLMSIASMIPWLTILFYNRFSVFRNIVKNIVLRVSYE